jgi:hypothetical protein
MSELIGRSSGKYAGMLISYMICSPDDGICLAIRKVEL